MRRALLPLALPAALSLAALGCPPTPSTAPPSAPVVARIEPATSASEPEPEADVAEPLVRLLLFGAYPRGRDCFSDQAFGDLRCAYAADGSSRPLAPDRKLRLYLTEPPGLVLAASDWEPARLLEEHEGEPLVAECAFEARGTLKYPQLEVVPGQQRTLYLGELSVLRVSACDVERHPGPPERLSAAHLVIMHTGSTRKPAPILRTREEALELARRAARDSAAGTPFTELVARYSDEPGAEQREGELGSFAPQHMVPVFSLLVLATPPGDRSAAFESAFGFHILERHADPPAPPPPPDSP